VGRVGTALAFDTCFPISSNRYGCRRVFPSRSRDNSETDFHADTHANSSPSVVPLPLATHPISLCGKPFASPSPAGSPPPGSPGASPAWRLGRRESHTSSSDIEATRKQCYYAPSDAWKSDQEKASWRTRSKARVRWNGSNDSFQSGAHDPESSSRSTHGKLATPDEVENEAIRGIGFACCRLMSNKSGNSSRHQAVIQCSGGEHRSLMKQSGVTNVVHTVAMGGRYFSRTLARSEPAVEIWSVDSVKN